MKIKWTIKSNKNLYSSYAYRAYLPVSEPNWIQRNSTTESILTADRFGFLFTVCRSAPLSHSFSLFPSHSSVFRMRKKRIHSRTRRMAIEATRWAEQYKLQTFSCDIMSTYQMYMNQNIYRQHTFKCFAEKGR